MIGEVDKTEPLRNNLRRRDREIFGINGVTEHRTVATLASNFGVSSI